MNQTEKEVVIGQLSEKFGNAPLVALSEYRGLTVSQMTELRAKLRQVEGELFVAKNTLTWRAVMETPNKVLEPLLTGPNVLAFSYGDPVAFAKVIDSYAGDHDAFQVKGAVMEGELLDQKQVAKLATMPGRDELRAKLLALMTTPATQLVRVLSAPAQQTVQVLEARRRELETAG